MLPFIYIFGKPVPMYGLMIATGIFTAFLYVYLYCKKHSLKWENALVIGICGLGLGFLGAKVLFIFVTYTPSQLIAMIKAGHFEHIINGGFVFYGGLIGGVLGGLLGVKLAQVKALDYGNSIIPIIPYCHAFGRLGCFFAGCCYGAPTDSVFSVVYTNPIPGTPTGIPLIPIQLYESLCLFIISGILIFMVVKKNKGVTCTLSCYFILYGILRIINEQFRYDAARGFYFGLSTSEWISIGLIIAGIILAVIHKRKKA